MSDTSKPPVINVTQVHKGCGSGCGTGCAIIIVILIGAPVISTWLAKKDTDSHSQLASQSPAANTPSTTPAPNSGKIAIKPPAKGDRVKLVHDTPLYFRDSVFRQGSAGEEFEVLDYRPDTKKVFLLSRGTDGKPIAFNVSAELVTIIPPAPQSTPKPSPPTDSRPTQREVDSFLGITEQALIRRLGQPIRVKTDSSPDGPFKLLEFDQTQGRETFFVIFADDGIVQSGQYRGITLSIRR